MNLQYLPSFDIDTFKMADPREVVGLSPGKPQVGKVDENVEFWREAKNWSWSFSVLLYLPTQKWDRRYVFSITEIVYEISFLTWAGTQIWEGFQLLHDLIMCELKV